MRPTSERRDEYYRTNVEGKGIVITSAANAGVRRLVFVSIRENSDDARITGVG